MEKEERHSDSRQRSQIPKADYARLMLRRSSPLLEKLLHCLSWFSRRYKVVHSRCWSCLLHSTTSCYLPKKFARLLHGEEAFFFKNTLRDQGMICCPEEALDLRTSKAKFDKDYVCSWLSCCSLSNCPHHWNMERIWL